MSCRSKDFYFKISGPYALWTTPTTKGGGEKYTYSVPTQQGLQGIADAIYFKPTIKNIIEEVKIISPIHTETKGVRTMVGKGKADLNYVTYLVNPVYLVKYHFIWNEDRQDLTFDRNLKKHEAIIERSIKKGGRRDTFLGTRECVAYVEEISVHEYENTESAYKDQSLSFGLMFNTFEYPSISEKPLIANYAEINMLNGVIRFPNDEDGLLKRELSSYKFKTNKQIKFVDEELKELN